MRLGFGGTSTDRVGRRSQRRKSARGPEKLEGRLLLTVFDFPLQNAGFESPELSVNNSFSPGVEGWIASPGPGTTFEVPWSEASPAPEGEQYVFGDADNWSLRQAGPVLAANTRYILSVDLFPLTTGDTSATLTLRDSAFFNLGQATYRPPWDASREDFQLPEGEWTTVQLGINTASLSPSTVGRTLSVLVEGSRLAVDNVRLTVDNTVHDFYLSTSATPGGDGFSAAEAFTDYSSLAPYLPLMPGERILLKAGDVFPGELNLRGKGTETDLITVERYGEGPNPIIRPDDIEFGRGLIWNNASHAVIRGIDVERAKIGFYLRYEFDDPGGENVLIENAHFRDLSDPTLDAAKHNFEYAWSDAIWVGGQAFNQAEFATRLDGLTIRNVSSVNAAHLFGTGWYFPQPFKSRLTNLLIEDAVAYDNLVGAFQLFGVDGGVLRRVHSIGGGGQDTWSGTTLGFVQNAKNLLIEDSEFAYIDRAQAADGSGMDFEGDTDNVTFRNNVVHNNAGSGLLILSTQGRHTNLLIEDNVFYNNAQDPWNSEINSEAQGSNDNHTGIIRNNSFYRGDPSINFFSPGADWSGFTITGNKLLEYESVRTRPTRWEFNNDGDLEGWSGFNDWGSPTVAGGVLSGQSVGADPYVESPLTWANSREKPYAWVRMSQSAGGVAQLFYLTETNEVWDEAKSVAFATQPDGNMHDYFIDLNALTQGNEIITQLRLDPATVAGADFEIDFIRLTDSTDPNQPPPSPALPAPLSLDFTSIASEDGHVLESFQNSGVGGSTSAGATTFRLGDDSANRAYRQFLSFDTSILPENAIVTEATIGIVRSGNPTGTIPIGVADSEWGDLIVDMTTGSFGGSPTLSAGDWRAPATREGVSKFAWPAYSPGQTIYSRLDDPHTPLVNTEGRTQFRVRYQNDDNGDFGSDYMSYATSNSFSAGDRPTLNVEFYIPNGLAGDYDQSGVVDDSDYGYWRDHFGATYGVGLLADGNGDGIVDISDYTVWRDNVGASLPATATATALATEVQSTETQSTTPALLIASPADDQVAERPTRARNAVDNLRGVRAARRALLLSDDAFAAWESASATETDDIQDQQTDEEAAKSAWTSFALRARQSLRAR